MALKTKIKAYTDMSDTGAMSAVKRRLEKLTDKKKEKLLKDLIKFFGLYKEEYLWERLK